MKNIFDQEPDMEPNMQNIQADAFTEAPQMADYDESSDESNLPYIPTLKNKPTPQFEAPSQPQGAPQKIDPQMYFQQPVHPLDRMKNSSPTAADKSKSVKDLMNTLNNMGESTRAGKQQETKMISDVVECLDAAIEHLSDINWLPQGKENLAPKLKKVAGPITDALKTYSKFLKSIE